MIIALMFFCITSNTTSLRRGPWLRLARNLFIAFAISVGIGDIGYATDVDQDCLQYLDLLAARMSDLPASVSQPRIAFIERVKKNRKFESDDFRTTPASVQPLLQTLEFYYGGRRNIELRKGVSITTPPTPMMLLKYEQHTPDLKVEFDDLAHPKLAQGGLAIRLAYFKLVREHLDDVKRPQLLITCVTTNQYIDELSKHTELLDRMTRDDVETLALATSQMLGAAIDSNKGNHDQDSRGIEACCNGLRMHLAAFLETVWKKSPDQLSAPILHTITLVLQRLDGFAQNPELLKSQVKRQAILPFAMKDSVAAINAPHVGILTAEELKELVSKSAENEKNLMNIVDEYLFQYRAMDISLKSTCEAVKTADPIAMVAIIKNLAGLLESVEKRAPSSTISRAANTLSMRAEGLSVLMREREKGQKP